MVDTTGLASKSVNDENLSSHKWTKGVANPDADDRVNIWSLNGYGQPVLTGGKYLPDEIHTLDETVKDYCASKNVTLTELCGGDDHRVHNASVRGAWQEIARCLPHRTVLSVYKRSLRQFHGLKRGPWSKEEVDSLLHLVELHGHRWKTIQDVLGRSATDCRVKFFAVNDKVHRGKWSVENVDLLLKTVRRALKVPHDGMDVREINQWTLKHDTKIPWTSIGRRVDRSRTDCYFKWKQMSRRSNKKAIKLGLEPVPMARETLKFDVRREYYNWKAEQDPDLPALHKEKDACNAQKDQDIQLLDSIIDTKATRPSQLVLDARKRERWEDLVDRHAPEDDLDLPLWKLAIVVKNNVLSAEPNAPGETGDDKAQDNQLEEDRDSRRRKRKGGNPWSSSGIEFDIPGVTVDKLQEMIGAIVDESDHNDLTTKMIRKLLEKQLGVDLTSYKAVVKKMVKAIIL
ncbi:hypothetical protein ACHAWF_010694 [Thalassiosira exigua]